MNHRRSSWRRNGTPPSLWLFPRQRRGVALIVVLAAMAILCGVLLPLVPPALRARRQVELEEIALQNQFLKYAVSQRLLLQSDSFQEASKEDLLKISGEVRFGPSDLLQGTWVIRRTDRADAIATGLEVLVRLEFQENSNSGASPWLIPKSEVFFPFPVKQTSESNQ